MSTLHSVLSPSRKDDQAQCDAIHPPTNTVSIKLISSLVAVKFSDMIKMQLCDNNALERGLNPR